MTQIEALMKKLDITEAEAKELLEADKRIDKGEKLFELSAEGKAVEKKMRQADRKPTVYKFTPRERKPNEVKRNLIQILESALAETATKIEVTNIERQLDFEVDGVRYRVVLSAPRKQGRFPFYHFFVSLAPTTAGREVFALCAGCTNFTSKFC